MGKGDARSKRGKIWRGTYGKTRPSKPPRKMSPAASRAKRAAAHPAVEKETPAVEAADLEGEPEAG
jgi:30S ribosomal protein S31